jgi:hypothetical protein
MHQLQAGRQRSSTQRQAASESASLRVLMHARSAASCSARAGRSSSAPGAAAAHRSAAAGAASSAPRSPRAAALPISLSSAARAAADQPQPPARCRRSEPLRGCSTQLSPTSSSMADRATSSLLSGTPTPAPRAVSSSAQESCICCGCDAASRLRRFACSHAAAAWLRWQRLCLLLLHAAASARCGGTGMSCRGASFLVALTLTAPMLAPGLVPTNSSSAGRLFSPTKSGCHLSASRRSIALSRCTPAAPAAARCRCRQRLGPPISRQLGLIALAPRVQQGAVFCAAGSAAVLQIFWTLCTRGAEGGQRRCLSESACSDSSGSSLTCTHAGLVLWRS